MNTIIQNILVFITLALALQYLIRKFVLPTRKTPSSKGCSDNDSCGCH
ncbi:FeoB-associated Cys-rich membrane protein [Psychroserpens sp. XS_ASV72]